MKLFFTTILFILSLNKINAQTHEMAISLLSLNGFNSNYASQLNYSSTNSSNPTIQSSNKLRSTGLFDLKPVFQYSSINKDLIEKSMQLGFFYVPAYSQSSLTSSNNLGQTLISDYQSLSLKKSVFGRIGINKISTIDKFIFKLGFNIPVEFNFYNLEKTTQAIYDKNNNLQATINYTDTKEKDLSTGLFIQTSFGYQVNHNISISTDFYTGIRVLIKNGKRTITSQNISPTSNRQMTQAINYRMDLNYYLDFVPSISLHYIFTNSK